MKHLRLSLAAIALMLAFSLPVFAGDILCGVTSAQPMSQSTASATSETETTATPASGAASELTAVDPATEIALDILQSLLSLF